MKSEALSLTFTDDAIKEIAKIAFEVMSFFLHPISWWILKHKMLMLNTL